MKNGSYNLVIAPEAYTGKRYRGKYCYEHHLVWWENTGEVLKTGELIHHKDENKRNNVFSNLEKLSKKAHDKLHHNLPVVVAEEITFNCYVCEAKVTMQLHEHRIRAKRVGHINFCCSRSCQVKKQRSEQG